MILWHGFVLLVVYFVRTSGAPNTQELLKPRDNVFSSFSFWPSTHNAAKAIRIRKRDLQSPPVANLPDENPPVAIEGGLVDPGPVQKQKVTEYMPEVTQKPIIQTPVMPNNDNSKVSDNPPLQTLTNVTATPAVASNVTSQNVTDVKILPNQMNINNPGVLKRALIVFGGFSLLGIAYYVFFKRKGSKNETNNTNTNDANQFRYGVLQSEDRRDNLELSRVPLTMESDEDDDEDLEIFDLGKKKSLSYVNLQTHEDDVDLSMPGSHDNAHGSDRQDLLLDIEDRNSETLINWSNNGNKFVL